MRPHAADQSALKLGVRDRRRHGRASRDVATTRSSRCNGCSTARPSPARRRATRTRRRTREEALRLYTLGSAWFTLDDGERGTLERGKLADLAVLSQDYMTVPVGEIGTTESLLTMVGGRIVYAAGPYVDLEDKTAR